MPSTQYRGTSGRALSASQRDEALPGFERINRYWDATLERITAKILPGEYYVTDKDEAIVTVLGSCVSACVRDRVFGIGGMNHFMLPHDGCANKAVASTVSTAARYGSYAMEHLINDVLKNGGHRNNLEVKIVGGGRIISGLTDIGERNVEFVRSYLTLEELEISGERVGGDYARKVYYFPRSGLVRVKALRVLENDTVVHRETAYRHSLIEDKIAGSVELFD